MLSLVSYEAENKSEPIEFSYTFDAEFCGVYGLQAILYRNGVDSLNASDLVELEGYSSILINYYNSFLTCMNIFKSASCLSDWFGV